MTKHGYLSLATSGGSRISGGEGTNPPLGGGRDANQQLC